MRLEQQENKAVHSKLISMLLNIYLQNRHHKDLSEHIHSPRTISTAVYAGRSCPQCLCTECYTQNHDRHSGGQWSLCHLDPPHPLNLLYIKMLYYIFPDQHASAWTWMLFCLPW